MATRRRSKNCSTKRCKRCGKRRLIKFFHANPTCRDGYQTHCKDCHADRSYDYDRRREYNLQKRYGISTEQYNELLRHQDFRCGACGKHESECKTRLHVDHCHRTGLVRGLLCPYCNRRVIGRHSPDRLIAAADYLRELPAVAVFGEVIVPERRH